MHHPLLLQRDALDLGLPQQRGIRSRQQAGLAAGGEARSMNSACARASSRAAAAGRSARRG
jgi:hypothetical protein